MIYKYVCFALLAFLLACFPAEAQEKLTPLASTSVFQERLKEEASRIHSIESDFTQEKYLDVFNQKVISKGRFYFRKENKIRMDYTSPVDYRIVINGQKLEMMSEGKSNVVNLGSNGMMNEMKGMLAGCMVGDLSSLTASYRLDYYETPSLYVVKIKPLAQGVQAYIREIVISLDKKDMSVRTLRLSENEKDYTEYIFTNKRYNTLSDDSMFAIP